MPWLNQHKSLVVDEYLEKLVKRADALRTDDSWTHDVDLGPVINAEQLRRVRCKLRRP